MKFKRKLLAGVTAASLIVGLAGVAGADNVQNDVVAGGNDTMTAGDSAVVNYRIAANNGDGENGCNATIASPATVTIAAPDGVTATPSSLQFTACGTDKSVTFTSTVPDDHEITVSVVDAGAGTYNTNPGKFTLHVVAASASDTTSPANAAITINDGDDWTNAPSVDLLISGTDAVGVAKYRLAETQAGLATASDVAVTPATTSFSETPSFTLTGADDASKAVWVRLYDAAGNTTDASDTIGLDTVLPTVTGGTGSYSPGDWTNQSVTVSFTCVDNAGGSGIAVDNVAGGTLTQSGADQSVTSTGLCEDRARNAAAQDTVSNIHIDKLPPVIDFGTSGIQDSGVYYFGFVPGSPTCTGEDQPGLSGTVGTCAVTGRSTTLGTHVLTGSQFDDAGNEGRATISYEVRAWTLKGFYSPVDKGIVNNVKAGQTVPLKFEVFAGDTELTELSRVGSFRVQSAPCGSTLGTGDDIEQYSTGGTSLRYDLTGGQFIQNWQVPKVPSNTCFKVTLTLADGTFTTADFRTK